jgi:hypothetical protein
MDRGCSEIRVLHNIAQGPDVDVYVNSKKVVPCLSYKKDTGYLQLPCGKYCLTVKPSGTNDVLVKANVTLDSMTYYTVVAHGSVCEECKPPELLVLVDNTECPVPGNSHVRLAHASADAPDVSVYVDGNKIEDCFQYGQITDYLPLPSKEHRVTIYPKGSEHPVIDGYLNFSDGHIYTIYASGIPGSRKAAFSLEVMVDANNSCVIIL